MNNGLSSRPASCQAPPPGALCRPPGRGSLPLDDLSVICTLPAFSAKAGFDSNRVTFRPLNKAEHEYMKEQSRKGNSDRNALDCASSHDTTSRDERDLLWLQRGPVVGMASYEGRLSGGGASIGHRPRRYDDTRYRASLEWPRMYPGNTRRKAEFGP